MKYIELHIDKPLSGKSPFTELELPVKVWAKNLYLEYGDRVPIVKTEDVVVFKEAREYVIFARNRKHIKETLKTIMEKQNEEAN